MKTIQGDLLKLARQGEFDFIFHGCNCFHLMGGGIAKSVSEQFPDAAEVDREATIKGDVFKLGDYTVAEVNNDVGGTFSIVNLYTQYQPGAHFEYAALKMALDLFLGDLSPQIDGVIRVGFPLIGAGIGGGDWDVIKEIIDNAFKGWDDIEVTIVEFVPA